ncbi:MAG: hypothetical protein COZ21_15490 [Bacteroidetes bacterium CG_4_10_14_3_um_filter_31_20]|nr:hypothetical protein [Bacteroidota bacterium]PIX32790.1 MAG: hypothetical protein COZ59_12120 [Bacteroidetes bacterium CG_4_8_14_3_um_filter_31_14]PIY02183.1 MAG: hypothetical protein COZ21_15490 [Bacteroidetes bacterium CG_4_10_14_3_um_filter_31_20]
MRIGYQYKKHLFIIGPSIPKFVKGGLFSYRFFPYSNKSALQFYLGADISANKESFIRTGEQAVNNKSRFQEGLSITGGTGVRIYFIKHIYLDWYMGLGYIRYHFKQESALNNFFQDYTKNRTDLRVELSIGIKL